MKNWLCDHSFLQLCKWSSASCWPSFAWFEHLIIKMSFQLIRPVIGHFWPRIHWFLLKQTNKIVPPTSSFLNTPWRGLIQGLITINAKCLNKDKYVQKRGLGNHNKKSSFYFDLRKRIEKFLSFVHFFVWENTIWNSLLLYISLNFLLFSLEIP